MLPYRFDGATIDAIFVIQIERRYEKSVMETVTISPKFQVVIPKQIREQLKLKPGQKVQAFAFENRIELIPVEPIENLRGFLRGMDTSIPREKDRY